MKKTMIAGMTGLLIACTESPAPETAAPAVEAPVAVAQPAPVQEPAA